MPDSQEPKPSLYVAVRQMIDWLADKPTLGEIKNELANLSGVVANLETDKEQAEEKVETLREEAEALRKERDSLQEQNQAQSEELDSIHDANCAELQRVAAAHRKEMEAKNEELSQVNDILAASLEVSKKEDEKAPKRQEGRPDGIREEERQVMLYIWHKGPCFFGELLRGLKMPHGQLTLALDELTEGDDPYITIVPPMSETDNESYGLSTNGKRLMRSLGTEAAESPAKSTAPPRRPPPARGQPPSGGSLF